MNWCNVVYMYYGGVLIYLCLHVFPFDLHPKKRNIFSYLFRKPIDDKICIVLKALFNVCQQDLFLIYFL